MTSNTDQSSGAQLAARPRGLEALEKLVGTWKISGGTEGQTTYEWMEGAFFLIQRGEVVREGQPFSFVQLIGYERAPGGEPDDILTGRLYTSTGDTLTYEAEVDDDTLTIWMGKKGSPAVYRGRFSGDRNQIDGAWEWPGGGYEETMTRVIH